MKNPHKLTSAACGLVVIGFVVLQVRGQDEPQTTLDSQDSQQSASQEQVAPPNPEAVKLLQDARTRLFNHESVQAELVQKVVLGGYRFSASGRYLSGRDFRTRLEFSAQLGEMEASYLEVCDGQILHTRRQINRLASRANEQPSTPEIELTRRDIQKILSEVQLFLDQPPAVRAAEIGIGGLPAILASLERTMIFVSLTEASLEGNPVLVIEGRWNPDERDRIMTGLGQMAAQINQFMPERVRVAFDQDTLFPRRIQYLQRASSESSVYNALLTVEFANVRLNQPIPIQQFRYLPPPGMEERDETATFVEHILEATNPPPVSEAESPQS